MKYVASPQPVLGPCACQDCGEPLYWARRQTRVLNVTVGSLRWRDWTGRIHKCLARAHATWDNTSVGSSDESNTIADGTRVPATTRDAGVIAFRGSSS